MRMGSSKTGVEKKTRKRHGILGPALLTWEGSKARSHDDSCAMMAKG